MVRVRMVSASRATADSFETETLLGRAVGRWRERYPIELSLYVENTVGLPILYNQEIDRAVAEGDDDLILAFLHDDVALLDFFWPETLATWCRTFDIVGLAGNVRRTPYQPTWGHIRTAEAIGGDLPENLCGAVAHGATFPTQIGYYGEPGRECKLMDGLFLAARAGMFRQSGLRFDPTFAFHFYDMDLCRQAEIAGVRMGVAPIPALHASGGSYQGTAWLNAYNDYIAKWGS
ncbi:MAG: hypothetical protein RLY86_3072 [Pseudomonadota bacterium]